MTPTGPNGVGPTNVPSGPNAAPNCGPGFRAVGAGAGRLTGTQFRKSVLSLLPFYVEIGSDYPEVSFSQGFSTGVDSGEYLFSDLESLANVADGIALQAAPKVGNLLPCPVANADAACVRKFIDDFAGRAYRRPLLAAEGDALLALYNNVRSGQDPLDLGLGIGAVVSAVLQSPQFLYHLELGDATGTPGERRLTSYEVASRLSYLYWDSPPDAMLLEKARTDALRNADVVRAEAERLLADPRSRDGVARFFAEWLGVNDRDFSTRTDLAKDLIEEVRRSVLAGTFDAPIRPLGGLLGSETALLNRRLATHYGLPTTGFANDTDWRAVPVPAPRRAGILVQGQVDAAHSPVGDTSVTQRGAFVNRQLLCVELGAPPAGAQDQNPMLPAGATRRQRVDARLAVSGCGGCHQILDNVGIGMEDIDELGRSRDKYASGLPVDAAGKLVALDGTEQAFRGTAALASKLGASDQVAGCVARQWYRFQAGHRETAEEEACYVTPLIRRFIAGGRDLHSLLLDLVATDGFFYRKDSPAP